METPAGHDASVTRDRLDVIVQHATDLGIRIDWEDLGRHRRGHCQVAAGRVTLNWRMPLVQVTSVLAHEVGHYAFGDTTTTAANERRAWEYGASLLIEPWEYAAAECIVGPSVPALAVELGVTVRVVEGWRRWWLRRGHLEHRVPVDVEGPL